MPALPREQRHTEPRQTIVVQPYVRPDTVSAAEAAEVDALLAEEQRHEERRREHFTGEDLPGDEKLE